MFYAMLALHLRYARDLRTAKRAGLISLFDRELVRSGRMERKFSRLLCGVFELRIEGDYRELSAIGAESAEESVRQACEFIDGALRLLDLP